MNYADLYPRTDIVYFGEGAFITNNELADIALAITNDFASRIHSAGEETPLSVTYDFGSPFDELDLQYTQDPETGEWQTHCVLYDKSDAPGMSALSAVSGPVVPQKIAAKIQDLVTELDIPPEHRMRQDALSAKAFQRNFVNEVLSQFTKTITSQPHISTEDLYIQKPLPDSIRSGYILTIQGSEYEPEGGDRLSVSIYHTDENAIPAGRIASVNAVPTQPALKAAIQSVLDQCIQIHDRKKAFGILPEDIYWFPLDSKHCISIWYSSYYKEFHMKLEERAPDGSMGPHCKLVSDESYGTGNISFQSLCHTLGEICNDANVKTADLNQHIRNLGTSIFEKYHLEVPPPCTGRLSLRDQIQAASSRNDSKPSDTVISIANYADDPAVKEAVLASDTLRHKTLDVCYKIPGYNALPRPDRNKLYDLIKQAVTLSELQNRHPSSEIEH